MIDRTLVLAALALVAMLPIGIGSQALAQQAPAAEPDPVFDKAFMTDPRNIGVGEEIWVGQCRHCHGANAYPGKGPKLNPPLLDPHLIFDRVTYGFQKMPAWKDVFSREQRMSVVAYIKSRQFSP